MPHFIPIEDVHLICDDTRDKVDLKLVRQNLYRVLDTLSEREKQVIVFRFFHDLNLSETAKHFGVSRERIRQIESKTLRKLRHPSRAIEFRKGLPQGFDFLGTPESYEEQIKKEKQQKQQELAKYWEAYHRHQKLVDASRSFGVTNSYKEPQPVSGVIKVEKKTPRFRAPKNPPDIVVLQFYDGKPTLVCDSRYGFIKRELDPETYDCWLEKRLAEHKASQSPPAKVSP